MEIPEYNLGECIPWVQKSNYCEGQRDPSSTDKRSPGVSIFYISYT